MKACPPALRRFGGLLEPLPAVTSLRHGDTLVVGTPRDRGPSSLHTLMACKRKLENRERTLQTHPEDAKSTQKDHNPVIRYPAALTLRRSQKFS